MKSTYNNLDELARTTSFPAIQIGNRVVIPRDKLIEWMNGQSEGCE